MANETIEDIVRDVRLLADRIEAAHKAETEENARLKSENAKMREALTRIAGGESANNAFEEVAWNMVQWAKAALAAEGGAK